MLSFQSYRSSIFMKDLASNLVIRFIQCRIFMHFLLILHIYLCDVYLKVIFWLLSCLQLIFLTFCAFLPVLICNTCFIKYFHSGQSTFLAYYLFNFSQISFVISLNLFSYLVKVFNCFVVDCSMISIQHYCNFQICVPTTQ